MEHRLIVYRERQTVFSAEFQEQTLWELGVCGKEEEVVPGSLYTARVENILPSIHAAFVRVPGEAENWYLPLEKAKCPVVSQTHADGRLRCGDELLVQVEREAGKKKTVTAVADFSLTGCYFVILHGKQGVHHSSKIQDKTFLQKIVPLIRARMEQNAPYGVMVRTNAEGTDETVLLRELDFLLETYRKLKKQALSRPAGTLLRKGLPAYLCTLRDSYHQSYDELVTDDDELFAEMQTYLRELRPELLPKLRKYEGACPLKALYRMQAHLSELLSERVWLRSGAYLVIQQTEAMAVIDVNTGKATEQGRRTDGIFRCNLEAAREIARQLRLRNLSGIILVDFIDMKSEEENRELLAELSRLVAEDRIETRVIDMTRLHLVELTRTKIRKPLAEQLRALNWRQEGGKA